MSSNKYKKLDNILKYLIIVLVIGVLVFAVLLVKAVLTPNKVPRTALERDLDMLQQSLKKNPKDPLTHNDLGVVYQQAGQYDNAISEYKIALKLNPKLDKPHFNLAMIYKGQGQIEKEESELASVISINPNYVQAYYELGKIAYSKKDYTEAQKDFKKAVEIDTATTDYHYWLGMTYEKQGLKQKAISEYKIVLKYIPDDNNALAALNRLGGK